MTREQHIAQARRSGALAVAAMKRSTDDRNRDVTADQLAAIAVEHATVAGHHALAAQFCRPCVGIGSVRVAEPGYGWMRCDACGGRGWRPAG